MIATSGFLTALECTKFVFGRSWGILQRSSDPLAGLRETTSKGKGRGAERRKRNGRRGDIFLSVAYLRCRQYVRNSTAALNTHTLIKLLI